MGKKQDTVSFYSGPCSGFLDRANSVQFGTCLRDRKASTHCADNKALCVHVDGHVYAQTNKQTNKQTLRCGHESAGAAAGGGTPLRQGPILITNCASWQGVACTHTPTCVKPWPNLRSFKQCAHRGTFMQSPKPHSRWFRIQIIASAKR